PAPCRSCNRPSPSRRNPSGAASSGRPGPGDPALPALRDPRPQEGHPHDRVGRVAALVALVAAGAGERLLHRLAGNNAERTGKPGLELDLLEPASGLRADVVVVARLPPNHGTH